MTLLNTNKKYKFIFPQQARLNIIAQARVAACLWLAVLPMAQAADSVLQQEEKAEKLSRTKAWYNEEGMRLPTAASQYGGVTNGILLAAATEDASPQGTIQLSNGNAGKKPGVSMPNIQLKLQSIGVKAKRFQEMGPLPGLNLTKEQIPGNIQSITAEEIKQSQSLSITDLLNSKLQSVNVNDYQGNPFQMDLTYRGFTAGPQIGTPQGLSVFFDGIRVNEPFGEVVNWDLIPMNAISSLDVYPGSNPIFGLNTLGGALSVKSKSGFDSPGISGQVLKGAYGRDQFQGSAGWNNGTVAAFGAVNLFMEDGWRDNSPSKVNQAFGKLEWQGEQASLTFSTLAAVNKLIGNGTVPIEMFKQDSSSVFTSPDETRNRLLQFQVSGAFDFNDKINLTGMVYNRDSRRVSSSGDIIDIDNFRDLGLASRKADPGELVSCVYLDANRDGFPNYYVDELVPDGSGGFTSAFSEDVQTNLTGINNGTYTPRYDLMGTMNPDLPDGYIQAALRAVPNPGFAMGDDFSITDSLGQEQVFDPRFYSRLGQSYYTKIEAYGANPENSAFRSYFTRVDPVTGEVRRFNIIPAPPLSQNCPTSTASSTKLVARDPVTGQPIYVRRDGAVNGLDGRGTGAGYIQGTPTGIITKSSIDQSGQGGAAQLNFNLDNHKFMLGASLDAASAKYFASQRFGLLDATRNVYAAPNEIGEEYFAGDHDVPVNDFNGKKITKSLYVSETWTPTSTLNISASARYNQTNIKNTLAPRNKFFELTDGNLINKFLDFMICPGNDVSECEFDPSKPVDIDVYRKLRAASGDSMRTFLSPAITEKFTYYSLNPALGATWQTTPRLNIYANWNQGTRTPSVIELGCAFDATPTRLLDPITGNPIGNVVGPRTLIDGRACSLPSVLSGDPYLPQVKAETFEVGARGKFKDLLEWNVTAYRTALKDDIYLVAANPQLSFFQSIGDTRRQGIEFGIAGEKGKADFRLNYSLTEASFQSYFKMISPNNSAIISNNTSHYDYNLIQVEPGDRMPGVPLNNLNATIGYKLTPDFKVSLGMVAHGDAFLRGNENNEHSPGPSKGVIDNLCDPVINVCTQTLIPGPDYRYSGKSPGYAVFNFRATYDLGKGWKAGLLVNNLFNKEYFSAGRLGLTPFAPSTYGAIGPGGFNYNSSEWLSTQFLSGGAPRGVWFTISYDFDASKKPMPPASPTIPEPDRSLEPAKKPPTAEELALAKMLEGMKPVPVMKANLQELKQAMQTAEQQVAAAIEAWRKARLSGDAETYLNHYAANFAQDGLATEQWREQRKMALLTRPLSRFEIEDLMVLPQGAKGMAAIFTERIESSGQLVMQRRMLALEQAEGRWVITRENALKTPKREAASSLPKPVDYRFSQLDRHGRESAISSNGGKP